MLKEEVVYKKEQSSTSGFGLVDQERLEAQVDIPSDDDGILLDGLDPCERKDDETSEHSSAQEELLLDQDLIQNDESDGLGELRFADSD